MTLLPTGTVTFLFSDIEGSTSLARRFPDEWPIARIRHNDLLQKTITAYHGYVFRIIGDEVNAAFETPRDALDAALSIQHALISEDWGILGSIRVRIGIHTGPARLQNDEEYEGYLTLSHVKRLMSLAYGGQILLSEASAILLRDSLPHNMILRNLGEHRLKDFEQLEQIFQAVAQDLRAEFPPLKSQNGPPTNLPAQLTSFVGRKIEIDEIKKLLSTTRLLTLTGPGGSGKTRLALQVAAELSDQFPDGIFFVALAPVTDPGLVLSILSQSLGIHETPGRSVKDTLKEYLRNKSLLLLLDNFEQVVSAAMLVNELLVECQGIKVLVTSREALRIRGEVDYLVPSLSYPDPAQLPPLESLSQYTAIELFVQRARTAKPDFTLTSDNAPAVASICHRLEGLPLAIELAAARTRFLPPHEMLTHLEHRLEFLTGGARDLPARQQTLRNAIAWSYDLLDENEQVLFRRLSVFVRGCTFEGIKAVVAEFPAQASLLDLLESLLDKSLLQQAEGTNREHRFVMLETIREFGLEKLEASGEQNEIHYRYASYYLSLAEQAKAKLESEDQAEWIDQMEQEHDNLRAALAWSKNAEKCGDICLRLAGAMGYFWEARGYFSEGRERLAAILETEPAQKRTAARAKLLARSAELAYRQSDYPATSALARESLEIYREVGDRQGMASALIKLGNAYVEVGDYRAATEYLEEALGIWRQLEDKHDIARALISLGWAALRPGNYALAKTRLAEALALSRELGDTRRMGFELSGLGEVALREGNYTLATRLVEESLDLRKKIGNKWGIGVSLGILGWIGIREEDWSRASRYLTESLEVRREIGDQSGCAWCLERLAEVALSRGQHEKAVRLFGAGAALRASINSVIDPVDKSDYDNRIIYLRKKLGKKRFLAIWEEGNVLSLESAVAYALEE